MMCLFSYIVIVELFPFCYLQYPTKALAPLMLEDYRKVMVDRRGEEEQFTSHHISQCMKKGTIFSLTFLFFFFFFLNVLGI